MSRATARAGPTSSTSRWRHLRRAESRGAGLGQGRQQINFLPEAHTDFIFAVVGEELGLWFTLGVVAVFAVMFLAGLAHLRRAPNLFHFLLARAACCSCACSRSSTWAS